MRLFKVVVVYCNGNYVPECKEIIIIKETPATYLVEATLASDHRSRINKMDQEVATTELEAWDLYLRRARQLLLRMGRDLADGSNNVNHAILERAYLINMQSDQDVKIGGTD